MKGLPTLDDLQAARAAFIGPPEPPSRSKWTVWKEEAAAREHLATTQQATTRPEALERGQ